MSYELKVGIVHCVEDAMPKAYLPGVRPKYYAVRVKGAFMPFVAMYIMDTNGACGWYTSFSTKIIEPVTHWVDMSLVE